jgi:hypothetical protein
MTRTIIQIILFLAITPLFAQKNTHTPIDKITFDKVVAFNYNLPGDTSEINRVDEVIVNGRLHNKLIKPGKTLSSKQQKELIKILNDTNSYGGETVLCFEPRLTYVFYNKEKIIGHVDICFECSQLESSIYIPAHSYWFDMGKGIEGFSGESFEGLLKLCNDLKMIFCLEEEQKGNE